DDPRMRLVATSAAGDGETRLLAVVENGLSRTMIANESALVALVRNNRFDFWMATVDPRPVLSQPPPMPAPQPLQPPHFEPTPTNLELAGAPGAVPAAWQGTGKPMAPMVTEACGRPGTCVVLEGESDAMLAQRIDATLYRGKRIHVALDARVENATCIIAIDSGIYAGREIPSGQLIIGQQ